MIRNEHFISLNIRDIEPDFELPGPLYLYISGKFIEYKKEGDTLPGDKYEQFILKKIRYIFTPEAYFEKYRIWIEENKKTDLLRLTSFNIGNDKSIIHLKLSIRKKIVDIFTENKLEEQKLQEVVQDTRSFIQEISSKTVPDIAWKKLSNMSKNIVDHSLNVALMSIYLANQLGFSQQKILENIFLGSLFHDYGKTMFDQSLYETGSENELIKQMYKHPTLGKEALKDSLSINNEILRIIEEHHENYDGSGYPSKKRKSQIYDLSKIVSISDEFDHLLQTSMGNRNERGLAAIEKLSNGYNHIFDPEKLQKCIKALNLVFQ